MKTLLALVLASSVAFAQAPVVVPAPKAPVVKVEKKKAKKKVVKKEAAVVAPVAVVKPVEVKK